MRASAGFTMVELAVVLVIIGFLSAIAMPSYQRIQRNSRFGALINDYRVFAAAFQQYNTTNAAWPAYSTTIGAFPAGMEEYLRGSNWSRPTNFGGYYNWDSNITHSGKKIKAAIAIYTGGTSTVKMTQAEMLQFDQRFDDGDLTSGFFRRGFANCPLYVIEN